MKHLDKVQLPDLSTATALEELPDPQVKRDEWLKQRIGKFTASEFHRLMTYEKTLTKFSEGPDAYVDECVVEVLTGLPANSEFENDATRWGKQMEVEAIRAFIDETGIDVTDFGPDQQFASDKGHRKLNEGKHTVDLSEHIGCTPDGRIGADAGIETKSEGSKKHLQYLVNLKHSTDLKVIDKKHYWQVQGCMMITNSVSWFFVSYDPRFIDERHRLIIMRIDRNEEDIEKLRFRLDEAISRKIERLNWMDKASTMAGL